MKLPAIAAFHGIRPAAILDNTSATGYVLDLASYPGAKGVLWIFGIGATDVAAAAMKIQQSDTKGSATSLTSGVDLHDFTTKPGATSDGGLYGVFIGLDVARKRYQLPVFTAGNGTSGTYVWAAAFVIGGDNDFDATDLGLTVFEEAA